MNAELPTLAEPLAGVSGATGSIPLPAADPSLPQRRARGHDVVVIGASTGGLKALTELLSKLPRDLQASLFIVLHLHPTFPSALTEILSRCSRLPVKTPLHGEKFEPGVVYVAPPDNHLMLVGEFMHVLRGPKENGHRPSVDALFRTASRSHGPNVVGIVLTGQLDCGTAGMISIKSRNGIAIVQDPAEASAPEMPQSVIDHVSVDHVARLSDIPALIVRLVGEPPATWPDGVAPVVSAIEGEERGKPVDIVCPLCQGPLRLTETGGFQLYRCHVGHAFSGRSIVMENEDHIERTLWAAARALEEQANLARRAAVTSPGSLRQRLEEKAELHSEQAKTIRKILLSD